MSPGIWHGPGARELKLERIPARMGSAGRGREVSPESPHKRTIVVLCFSLLPLCATQHQMGKKGAELSSEVHVFPWCVQTLIEKAEVKFGICGSDPRAVNTGERDVSSRDLSVTTL